MADQASTEISTKRVIGGIDTHKDAHVIAVIDGLGRKLDTASFPAHPGGYRDLCRWLCAHGEVLAVGVEGTGSWGAGLSRHLRARGIDVIEVNRLARRGAAKASPTPSTPKPRRARCWPGNRP